MQSPSKQLLISPGWLAGGAAQKPLAQCIEKADNAPGEASCAVELTVRHANAAGVSPYRPNLAVAKASAHTTAPDSPVR